LVWLSRPYKDGRHCGTPPCWDWCDRYNIPGPVQKISICFDEKSPASFTGESKETLENLPFELLLKQALCRVEGFAWIIQAVSRQSGTGLDC